MPSSKVYAVSEEEVRRQWSKNNSAKLIDNVVMVEKGKPKKGYSFPNLMKNKYRVDWHYRKGLSYKF